MTLAHATPDLLAGYADGSLGGGMCLAVAGHLTFCPVCRDRVARLEAVGGALLAEAEPAEPPPGCLERTLARLDAPEPEAAEDPLVSCPLRRRLGPLSDLGWRSVLPGLSECRLEGFAERVSLMRGRPGTRVPAHTHTGREATLVLAGRVRDGAAVLGRGDLAVADAGDHHRPEVVGHEPCLCLLVLEGPVRFTGPLGPVLNRLP
jgi:putative transcriptional regulator